MKLTSYGKGVCCIKFPLIIDFESFSTKPFSRTEIILFGDLPFL